MAEFTGQTFEESDLFLKMFCEAVFTNCQFNGNARRCNFHKASFDNCIFSEGFKFINCLITGVTGINESLVEGGNFSTLAEYQTEITKLTQMGFILPEL